MGTLRFFEEVVSFKIRRTFGFADYSSAVCGRCRAFFLRVQATSDSGEPPVQPAMPRLNTYFKMGLIVIFEESPPIVEPQGEGEVFNIVVFGGLACTCSRG